MCSPTWKTHIPSDMCSSSLETHIPSDMCSPTWKTHIPNDICSPPGTNISLLICVPLVICVLLPGKHISLVICVLPPGKHISVVVCVPPPGKVIFLVICVSQVGKHIASVLCSPTRKTRFPFNMCSPTCIPKGLTRGFRQKLAIFLPLFFLGNIGQEYVFYYILERKNAFLAYKNKTFKKWKIGIFS